MSHAHNLIESLAQDRQAERYRHARPVMGRSSRARTLETTRRRAGWWLVGLGLRRVAGESASQRARLIGQ